MRLLRPLGDGHAFVLPAEGNEDAQLGLPVKFYRFPEGLFVTAAAEAYRQLVGAQVLSVDGHPVDEVLAAVEPLISRDNDQQVTWLGPEVLRWTPLIHALGLTGDPGQATLTVRFPDQTTATVAVAVKSVADPRASRTDPRPAGGSRCPARPAPRCRSTCATATPRTGSSTCPPKPSSTSSSTGSAISRSSRSPRSASACSPSSTTTRSASWS